MNQPVKVLPSGRHFEVAPTETVLEAALRQHIPLPYGCKDGACGACKCRMSAGQVVHKAYQEHALSAQEAAQGFILTCRAQPQTGLEILAPQVGAADAAPVRKMPVRVRSLQRLAPDVMHISLQLPAATPLLFQAGQYIDILLEGQQRRSYSIATAPHQVDPEQPVIDLHIRHLPGGLFGDHVFGRMQERDILRIEGPFGSCCLRPNSAAPLLFLASGTGFAPVQAMLAHLVHTQPTRSATLYWGARRPADLYLHDWLRNWCAQHPQIRYEAVLSDLLPQDNWNGRTGLALEAMLADVPDMRQHELYVCGAPAMVQAAQRRCTQEAALSAEAFFADAFVAAYSAHNSANT